MAHAIMTAENGPDIAYHLGTHLTESARIARLPSLLAQGVEIGKLAARLAMPAAPAPRRRAPDPTAPTRLPKSRHRGWLRYCRPGARWKCWRSVRGRHAG
jgi:hypothetical protein